MLHRITCMYINFQQTRISRSVTNRAQVRKLHKFATTDSKFTNHQLFQICINVQRTCISIFSIIGLVEQSKLCTQMYLQKIVSCINLQLAIKNSKNHAFRTCTTP